MAVPVDDFKIKDNEFLKSDLEIQFQQDDQQLPAELLHEIDMVLGEAVSEKNIFEIQTDFTALGLEDPEQDYGIVEMQQTFLDLISHNLSPLSRYVKAFTMGANYETILELCDLIISPILPRLKEIELLTHAEELTFFKSVVHFAKSEIDPKGRDVMRHVVFRSFKELKKKFHLSCRGSKVAVKNLILFLDSLKANPEISDEDIQRFFSIGVPSLTWVRKTSSLELHSLSGVSVEVIRKIRALAKDQKAKGTALMSGGYKIEGFKPKSSVMSEDDIKDPYIIQIEDDEKDYNF